MNRRYDDQLMARLERLWLVGETEIHREELKLWYDKPKLGRRLGVKVWRDIQDRWETFMESDKYPLLVSKEHYGNFIFIWGVGLTVTDTEEAWFRDLSSLASRASGEAEEPGEGDADE